MAQNANESIEIDDLSKGINLYDGDVGTPVGFYAEAQNMLLTHKAPITVGGLTKLNTTAAPDSRNILWFEPFSSAETGSHSDVAHSDTAHSDTAHSDTAHSDTAHGDVAHSDVAHSDNHSDTHSDTAHSDIAHSDETSEHGDSNAKGHSDSGGVHSDVAHSDTVHSDTHSDTHSDIAHSDGHSDTAHSDTVHTDIAHSDASHSDISHSDGTVNASFVVALDRGADTDGDGSGIWSYNPNNDTWSHLWTYCFSTAAETLRYRTQPPYFSSVPFRGRLFWSFSGTTDVLGSVLSATNTSHINEQVGVTSDNPLKHDGLIVSPVGAAAYSFDVNNPVTNVPTNQRVATFETTETWTTGTALTSGGNRKGGLQGRELVSVANMFVDYTASGGTARDFLTGLLGAPNFGTTDWFVIWTKRTSGTSTATLRFRFGDNANTAYFEGSFTPTFTNGQWYELAVRRSQLPIVAGAPVWSSIERFTIFSDTASQTIVFDEGYFQYTQRVGARGAIVEMYNNQLVLGDLYDAKTAIRYSNVGSPDYMDSANVARFDGGRLSLGDQDRVTALWTYFDELIVGKNSSAWTFSGAGTNVSISALPLTIGVQGNRALVETPWSLHYHYDNNIFGARLTSRGLVSTNITDYLSPVDINQGHRTTSIRHDPTHTVRWSFRTRSPAQPQNDLGLIYDYQLDAWASKYTPKIRHYAQWINYNQGIREMLCAQYDGYIRRVDTGTTFDGTAIESYFTIPWQQPPKRTASGDTAAGVQTTRIAPNRENVVQWMDVTAFFEGNANVLVEGRFADDPHEFDAAAYTTFGSILATPDGDKGFIYLGRTARFCQLRFRATSGSFEVSGPIIIGYNVRGARV